MKRFSVMVQEYGSNYEVELCQLDGDPKSTVLGLQAKTLMIRDGIRRRSKTPKYTSIRVVDNQAENGL